MPYTAFYARQSFINHNQDLINKFNKAINKGLDYVNNHSAKEIAEIILPQFPDNSLNDIEVIVQRYKDADSWLNNIMIDNNLLNDYVPFKDLVINLND